MKQIKNKPEGGHVMPASKMRYDYNDEDVANMQCWKEMFGAPRRSKRKRKADSDSSSSDDICQSKQASYAETTQYCRARALDSMLLNAGVGGLATWREENPPCSMLSPIEYRYVIQKLRTVCES